jgi:hypothetical protein
MPPHLIFLDFITQYLRSSTLHEAHHYAVFSSLLLRPHITLSSQSQTPPAHILPLY